MLSYLVTSEVRRRLLKILWLDGLSGSVSELSRLADVAFAAAHKELGEMANAELAVASRNGNAVCYRANTEHPHADLLRRLLKAETQDQPQADSHVDRASAKTVMLNLAAYGAPVGMSGTPTRKLSLEATLAAALKLAHDNPTIVRVMPVTLYKNWNAVRFERLAFFVDQLGERQALGLFLDLTGAVSDEKEFHRVALKLRDNRIKHMRDFFHGTKGKYAQALAEQNTPPVARNWHFRMNMGMDVFESIFKKFVGKVA